MRLRWFLIFAVALFVSLAQAGVYQWKDAEGRVHFSDKPPEGAQARELKLQTFTGPAEVESAGQDYGASNVVMLSTTWCGVCKRARAWMQQKGIAFTEYDVEKSEIGKAEYRRLNGRGVPIILVGSQRMNGFSAEQLEQMLRTK